MKLDHACNDGIMCLFILKNRFPLSALMVYALKSFAVAKLFAYSIWQGVLDGKYDDLSEQSFYMVGGIDEVIAKAEKIAKESAA